MDDVNLIKTTIKKEQDLSELLKVLGDDQVKAHIQQMLECRSESSSRELKELLNAREKEGLITIEDTLEKKDKNNKLEISTIVEGLVDFLDRVGINTIKLRKTLTRGLILTVENTSESYTKFGFYLTGVNKFGYSCSAFKLIWDKTSTITRCSIVSRNGNTVNADYYAAKFTVIGKKILEYMIDEK
ncbi:hypothetical protein DL89DRAFT_271271 [Linderina pennispora]|uniref:Uncharacterized protein n=1 Tax=Linderina pennispora TaxID=61395 RepID=A0A1Y1VVH1_9FUNG|nr:uncharacterized protein DL89DRAFT_271271 [Linderina pennispora]ORX65193.1 hypothetical protein DL89DRAFT_271271 [Linderina pennispora]